VDFGSKVFIRGAEILDEGGVHPALRPATFRRPLRLAGLFHRQPRTASHERQLLQGVFITTRHKTVILSGAPHRFIASHSACGAESKDLGGAYLTQVARSFSATEARKQDLLEYALDGHGYIFACTRIIFHVLGSRPESKFVAGPPGAGFVVEKLRATWVR
jgi:hypothetical protein